MAAAILSGSFLSSGSGLPLFTPQNPQFLVHVSPISIKVAVRLLKHSNILGHFALWQTVWRHEESIRFFIADMFLLSRLIFFFNHGGFLSNYFSYHSFKFSYIVKPYLDLSLFLPNIYPDLCFEVGT